VIEVEEGSGASEDTTEARTTVVLPVVNFAVVADIIFLNLLLNCDI
jgi:hypothetical protein